MGEFKPGKFETWVRFPSEALSGIRITSLADVRLKCIVLAVHLKTLARQGVGG